MDSDGQDLRARLARYRAFQDQVRQGALAGEVALAERARRRRRRVLLAGVAAAIVLLVGFGFALRVAVLPERQARATALAYLEQLADPGAWLIVTELVAPEVIARLPRYTRSDGTTQPAMLGQLARTAPRTSSCLAPGLGSHGQGPTNLRAGCYTPPTDITVTEVTVDDEQAVVSVAFGVAGDDQRYTGSLRLRRDTGAIDRMLARWVIVDGFGTLDIRGLPAGLSRTCRPPDDTLLADCVRLDGLPVAAVAGNNVQLPVLPGRHQLEVHVFNPFDGPGGAWHTDVHTVVVPPGGQVTPEPVT